MSTNSFYVTGGTLRLDAPSYVERQADRDLFESLLQGEFCYVLTSRQMGKSSLMVRTANKLRSQGAHVIALDLSAIGQNLTPEQWYNGLLTSMGDQLGLEDELEQFWIASERLGPVQHWFASIRKAVMAWRRGKVVVFLDEIDSVRSLPFSTDEFFAAIRECYNRRAEDPEFNRLTFCLLGVATPSDLIRDTRITPFNIGRRIELNDFTTDEAAPLAKGLHKDGAPRVPALLRRVLFWTSGHPYLTQRLCHALARDLQARRRGDVDRVCEELFFSNRARERDDNLIFVRERMLRSEADLSALLDVYLNVSNGKRVADEETNPLISIMRLSGIVRSEQGRLQERNHIYSGVFDRYWVKANLPDADLRRQRAAFLRGVFRTAGIAAIVVAAMTITGLIAMKEVKKARRAMEQSFFTQAQFRRASGLSGQRYESLSALRHARDYYRNETALRDEAIACLALVDMKEETNSIHSLQQSSVVELNLDLGVSATAQVDGAVTLRNLQDGQLLKTLPGFGLRIQQLRFAPNEPVLVAEYRGGSDERIIVWDWQKGQKLFALPHGIHAEAIDFSPVSRQLAVGQTNGLVSVYSLSGGEISHELELRLASGFPRVPQVLRFSPAGDLLAESCLDDPYVQIWNLHTTQAVAGLFHPDKVYDLSWHPRGELLATACRDFCVYLWNINAEDRPMMKKLIGHEGGVRAVTFNHRGTLIATLGLDETVRLWVPATERQIAFRVDGKSFDRLQFSQNDRRLMAIDDRRTNPRVWEVSGDEYLVLQARAGPVDPLKNIDFSLDGRWLAAVSGEYATIWDSHSGRELGVLSFTNAHAAWFSADSQSLVVSTDSGLFKCPLSYPESGNRMQLDFEVFQQFSQAPDELGIMALASDRSAAVVVHQEEVLLLPLESDCPFGRRVLHVGSHYQRLALHPQAEWMATATRDPSFVHLWNLAPVEGVNSITLPSTQYFNFSPDGKWLVTCWAGEFQFYRVGDWQKPAFSIRRNPSSNQHAPVAFTRDGRTAAIAASRYTIQLVRLPQDGSTQPETIATLESPDRRPLEILAFSADGSRLAAANMNHLIQLWNLALLHDGLAKLKLEGGWPVSP